MNVPSQTILTNELKLHDYKGTKLSITFGEADINDGYSYARVNYKASEEKIDFSIDKPTLNFISDRLTLNDNSVWNMAQQGPNTGMNSDMVDGLHAYDLKDRLGSHHYIHMLNTSSKKFVKIATLTPRKVGEPNDFRTDGKNPYSGIFGNLALRDKIGEFEANTPIDLSNAKNITFQSTDMITEGIYNSCLRGTVTILNGNIPSTVDFHIGLFSDPLEESTDGWELKKCFYISTHDINIPLVNEGVVAVQDLESSLEKVNTMIEAMSENDIEPYHIVTGGTTTATTVTDAHERPAINRDDYTTPVDASKDYTPPSPFAAVEVDGESYGKEFQTFRLYFIGSTTETIDGIKVITHKYDLYMAIESKSEFHITPYMSSSAVLYNFEKPITEGELPTTKFIRPKSIYDDRYAYKKHRHFDYEDKITNLIGEVDTIWNTFDSYVQMEQGIDNAKKVLMTDNGGSVFATTDNFERHNDTSRKGSKVLVSTTLKCIGESSITTGELAQLEGIHGNVQEQIHDIIERLASLKDDLEDLISAIVIPDVSNFLNKTGDTMTGNLKMANMSQIQFTPNGNLIYIYAGDNLYDFGVVAKGINVLRYNNENACLQIGSSAMMFGTKKLSIGSTAPVGANNGDIWIKNS